MSNFLFNQKMRLRSGWRILFFVSAFMVSSLILSTFALALLNSLSIDTSGEGVLSRVYASSIGLVLAILLGWLCGKLFEDLPFRALGAWFTKYWLKDLVLGILIGGISVAIAVLIAAIFGGLRFEYNEAAGATAIQVSLAVSALVFLIGAAFEEALVRGYIFQTLTRANLAWVAIVFTSLFFAAGHLGNPNTGYFPFINTALAGVWLAVAYLKTRTLWFVFGVHFAWNWIMGGIFGVEVSGLTDIVNSPLLKEIDSGPDWLTGGIYGLEGGISCTIALLISTAAIWFLPILKATDEMTELTSIEKPLIEEKA